MSVGRAFLMSRSNVSVGCAFLMSRSDVSAVSIFASCVDQIEMIEPVFASCVDQT